MFGFGKFTYERQLVKELRKRSPDPSKIAELKKLLTIRRQFELWPVDLFWDATTWSERAQRRLAKDDPLYDLIVDIHASALWEIQYRHLRGV